MACFKRIQKILNYFILYIPHFLHGFYPANISVKTLPFEKILSQPVNQGAKVGLFDVKKGFFKNLKS